MTERDWQHDLKGYKSAPVFEPSKDTLERLKAASEALKASGKHILDRKAVSDG